jgi:hypothetical protein
MAERPAEIGVAEPSQALACGGTGWDGGQALLGVTAMSGEMRSGQALQQRAMRRVEVTQGDEVVGQRAGLVLGPGVECGHQRRLVDQAGLKGQHSEEKMARCVVSSAHGSVLGRGFGIAWERTDRGC